VEEIKRTIPHAIALDPLINITRMQRHLEEQFNRSFSFYYTRKLMHKGAMQCRMEADRTQIEQRMNFTQMRRALSKCIATPDQRSAQRLPEFWR
jgi:hypothetical protein